MQDANKRKVANDVGNKKVIDRKKERGARKTKTNAQILFCLFPLHLQLWAKMTIGYYSSPGRKTKKFLKKTVKKISQFSLNRNFVS